MTNSKLRPWAVLLGCMAVAWSLVFSVGLTAPTGMATSRGKIHASTGASIPGVQVSLARPTAKAAPETLKPRQGFSSLPAAAQPAVSATLGENDGRYQVAAIAGALRAQNPAQALQADFTRQGMEVRSGRTHWRLALGGYGYGDRLEKVGVAAPQNRANRVEYPRGPLVEWYVNGPAGLEQGFTLSAPPASGASGTRNSSPLTIALEIGGDLTASADLPAEVGARAEGLTLRDGRGQAVLRYTGLTAHDASGQELAAWLELGKEELRLRVEDAGARYPVVVDPFVQQAVLSSSDSASGDQLGYSVAYSSDGTTIVAGAPFNNPNQGAVYVFVIPAGGWATTSTYTAKLTASSGVSGDGFLGWSVGVSSNGSTIVAGAPNANFAPQHFQGAVYVFVNSGTGWANATQTAMLTASDGAKNYFLGYSVGISSDGGTIVAGAQGATIGSNPGQGAAYVYVNPGSGWVNATQNAKLTASDGEPFDQLGYSVGISTGGSTIVAGAPEATIGSNSGQGAAYVFTMPVTGWVDAIETAKLTASDGGPGDSLGSAVGASSDGSTMVAGAPDATVNSNSDQGATYVFVITGGVWGPNETAKLTNTTTGGSGDLLGASVGISSNGSAIVAGAPGFNSATGAVDVFVEPVTGWATTTTYTNELAASKMFTYNFFGNYVGVTGDGLAIASGLPGINAQQGAVALNLTVPTLTFTGAPPTEPYMTTFSVPDATTSISTSPVYTSSGSCTNSGTTYTMTSGTGSCVEIATLPGGTDYASVQVFQKTTASKIAPSVTFTGAPPSAPYQGTFTVTSTTTSSTSPTYTASGSCTNVGTLYTATKGTGTCTSKVSWVTDANYLKASLTQTTTGTPIGQTVSFTTSAPSTASYQSTFPVAASSDSGLTVALSVAAGSVCSLGTRTTVSGVTSATVTMKGGTGTCYINANQAGNNNYIGATQQQTWAAALPVGQTISITTPASAAASVHSTFPVAADSSSGLKVALSVDAGSTGVCKLGPRTTVAGVTSATVTMLKNTGTCTIDANQAGNGNYSAAAQQQTSAAATP